MSENTRSLFCLIQNKPPAPPSVFEVTVPVHARVTHLQKAIKKEKEHELERYDADSLILWKVSVALRPAVQVIADA